MRSILITWIIAGILIVSGCSTLHKGVTGDQSKAKAPESIQLVAKDSTEYELLIIDPGFDQWFITHRKPVWYYSHDYLRTKNLFYVTGWNEKVRDTRYQMRHPNNPFILQIDYRPQIDYGLELDWKLFHYFRYIEESGWKIY
ncbi:MAG: hypothetical protein J7L89_00945 [Bacteroidales bacterium]|nr:hypothetical protein [Bacteroidales bacterium]